MLKKYIPITCLLVLISSLAIAQFADGTGSNANSASALIQAGQPNLRSLYPLEYDIRHKINANATFDLSEVFVRKRNVFSNTSLSIFGNARCLIQ